MKKNILNLLALVLVFSALRQKGPLVLEPEKLPLAATEPAVRQVGGQVELSWKFPTLLSDKKTPLQFAHVPRRRHLPPGQALQPGDLPEKKRGPGQAQGRRAPEPRRRHLFAYGLPIKAKLLKDKEHSFALTYQYGR